MYIWDEEYKKLVPPQKVLDKCHQVIITDVDAGGQGEVANDAAGVHVDRGTTDRAAAATGGRHAIHGRFFVGCSEAPAADRRTGAGGPMADHAGGDLIRVSYTAVAGQDDRTA